MVRADALERPLGTGKGSGVKGSGFEVVEAYHSPYRTPLLIPMLTASLRH